MDDRSEIYVGGSWVAPTGGRSLNLISPHSEEQTAQVALAGPSDVDIAVASARESQDEGPWPRVDPGERIDVIRRLAALYADRRQEIAAAITEEIGAPTTFANRAHVALPLLMMGALADIAGDFPWQAGRPGVFGSEVVIRKHPVGVVAAIVPWNMPQFLIVTKLVPALLAGCSVIIKPAPESPIDALILAEIVAELELPPGVVSVLPGGTDIGELLVAHPGVDKVSFTGSTAAGRAVAAVAGAGLKRVSLELGGKSAAIALEDSDPAAVAVGVRIASLGNSGQICNALTRVLVPRGRTDQFVDALTEEMSTLRVGDPHDPATDVGPLVTERQQQRVRKYIDAGVRDGARLVLGGVELPDGVDRGWYVQPTLFADVDNHSTIAREEIFGPVISIIPYTDEEEAVRIANDSEYGLAGSVWTSDADRGFDIAARVRAGTFGINQGYSMDPVAPFGGVKGSGMGRELGTEGLEGYVETKSISVAAS